MCKFRHKYLDEQINREFLLIKIKEHRNMYIFVYMVIYILTTSNVYTYVYLCTCLYIIRNR